MSNQECVDFVATRIKATPTKSVMKIAEEVLDFCLADDPKTTGGIGGDNMTCIIAKLPKL